MKKEIKVGDKIRIHKKPEQWASLLNNNCPLKLKFPHTLVVKELKRDNFYTAMTCGNYGWDLNSIIKAGFEFVDENISVGDKVLWKGFEGVVVLLDGYGGYIVQLEDGDKVITQDVEKKFLQNSEKESGLNINTTEKHFSLNMRRIMIILI